MSITGSCLCGSAEFTIDEVPTTAGACHCSTCRKWSGGISMSVEVPPGALNIVSGDTIGVFASSEWGERAFCEACGSSLYFRITAEGAHHGTCYVSMGALDDAPGITLTEELFIDEKPSAYALQGSHTTMTGAEFFDVVAAEVVDQVPDIAGEREAGYN